MMGVSNVDGSVTAYQQGISETSYSGPTYPHEEGFAPDADQGGDIYWLAYGTQPTRKVLWVQLPPGGYIYAYRCVEYYE